MNSIDTDLSDGKTLKEPLLERSSDSKFITVVSGLPRSGTSMMMRMLDMGRMPLLVDNLREPDIDNPKGYYEYERVKELETDNSCLGKAQGRAVKIVSPILRYLDLHMKYKIIFMLRDLEEILASQRKMADRLNKNKDHIRDNILKHNYSQHLEDIKSWLEKEENIDVMYINYRDVISDPFSTASDICSFLHMKLNTQDMALVVENSLYRQKADQKNDSGHNGSESKTEDEMISERLKNLGYL